MAFSFYSEKKGSSQAIFDALSEEWPLSIKEIHQRLKRKYSMDITYQGVHKKILELEKEGVLEKSNKKLLLNQSWVREQINLFQAIENKYSGKSLPLRQLENTPKTHSFRTPMELARFVIDFTLNCENPQKKAHNF